MLQTLSAIIACVAIPSLQPNQPLQPYGRPLSAVHPIPIHAHLPHHQHILPGFAGDTACVVCQRAPLLQRVTLRSKAFFMPSSWLLQSFFVGYLFGGHLFYRFVVGRRELKCYPQYRKPKAQRGILCVVALSISSAATYAFSSSAICLNPLSLPPTSIITLLSMRKSPLFNPPYSTL